MEELKDISIHTPEETAKIYETTILAGEILLENGAEIFRIEETMKIISEHYGEHTGNFYVLRNGIFTTSGERGGGSYAKVRNIPVKSNQLEKVSAVNQLSREIIEKDLPVEEAFKRLNEIRNMKGKSRIAQILAAGVGSAAFCWVFGGSLVDGLIALAAGLLLQLFMVFTGNGRMSKILSNLVGGFIAAIVCALFHHFGVGDSLYSMLVGAVISLVPGIAFTNGIRDMVEGDYLAGTIRLLDALVVFASVAVGMAVALTIFSMAGGVII